ncbi:MULTISPECIES: DsbA family protein [Enterococcaceae]|uniref:DsbA family protein n=1 Tax=Enterococcaceae TaxID=81852 RepID=UPI000E4D014B|nr:MULTISPECIES: DsbA family protein [Enterococcaceae]RGI30169.1 DsbA family protein [Melissococcus sp. OM08-11BH]UNM89168.1 DsbA family protein [Vagococcus sp. CY52-2]
MVEIYLFVNPLDELCLLSEQRFLEAIEHEETKVYLKLIPILNPLIIHHYLIDNNYPTNDLVFRNHLIETVYSACLDVKAAQLQGKKMGRKFLFHLQNLVGKEKMAYSDELVDMILTKINADKETFKLDRQSKLIKEFFKIDQQIANEMGINRFAKAVIFNYDSTRNFGVLIDAFSSTDLIKQLLKVEHTQTNYAKLLEH